MELLKVDDLEEALSKLTREAEKITIETEECDIFHSFGRTLAEDIVSEENIPGFARSVMDGYAVRSQDVQGAGESIPGFLEIVGEVQMGNSADMEISAGQCVYVPTGAMLPKGSDAVVMEEYCEKSSDTKLAVYKSEAPGSNVAADDEDVKKGETVLLRGHRLKAQDMGLLAALGRNRIKVYKPLKVFIISTGDELLGPEEESIPGKVRDVNSYGIAGMAAKFGFEIAGIARVRDSRDELAGAVEDAKGKADIIVISGGSSKGRKDITAEIIDKAASSGIFTHGIAVKPGKPTILGVDIPSRSVIVGLPGHPVAALMLFDLIVGGLWREKTGQDRPVSVWAQINVNIPSSPGRKTFQLVNLISSGEENIAQPVLGKSGMIYTMSRADGYIIIYKNQEGLKKGQNVQVFMF